MQLLPSRIVNGQENDGADVESVKWALLADTHVAEDKEEVYNNSYPYRNLTGVVPAVVASAPSAAVIVGDVARLDGQPGDYVNVRTLLKPLAEKTPVFLGLGNHDHRDNFLKAFPASPDAAKRQAIEGKHVLVADQGPIVRLVLLDSLQNVNEGAGNLGNPQVAWLEKFLASADDVPIVICVHHTLGHGGGDLQDADRMFELLEPAKQVKAIFYGHSHRFAITERKGIHLINLPPIGYRFDEVNPLGWLETDFSQTGASMKLHTVQPGADGDGRVSTLRWR